MKKLKEPVIYSIIIFIVFFILSLTLGSKITICPFVVYFIIILSFEIVLSYVKDKKYKLNNCKRWQSSIAYLFDVSINGGIWVICFFMSQQKYSFLEPFLMIIVVYNLNANLYYPSVGNFIWKVRVIAYGKTWKVFFSNTLYLHIYIFFAALILYNPLLGAITGNCFYMIDMGFRFYNGKNFIYRLMKVDLGKII